MTRPVGSKNKPKEDVNTPVDNIVETVNGQKLRTNPDTAMLEPIKERVRKLSTNRDHMGEGEPLCFTCGHRSDMHYTEHRWTEQRVGKNLQGDFLTVEERKSKKVYDGARPCQHACLCKAYD